MVELYLHSLIRLHGAVLNSFNTAKTLHDDDDDNNDRNSGIVARLKQFPGLSPPTNYTDRATAACRRS
jgi:hypothetical protein